MIDVALTLLALIAGGLTLELFASANTSPEQESAAALLPEELYGNPS